MRRLPHLRLAFICASSLAVGILALGSFPPDHVIPAYASEAALTIVQPQAETHRYAPLDYAKAVRLCANPNYAKGFDPVCVNQEVADQLGINRPFSRNRERRDTPYVRSSSPPKLEYRTPGLRSA